jgi:hypothetical protein
LTASSSSADGPTACFDTIHDTLALFARSLAELHGLWSNRVASAIGSRAATQVRRNRDRLFTDVTDAIRHAVTMAPGRGLTPDGVLEVCREGLGRVLAGQSLTQRGI